MMYKERVILWTLSFLLFSSLLGVDDRYAFLYEAERFLPSLELLIRNKATLILVCILVILWIEGRFELSLGKSGLAFSLVIFQVILAIKLTLVSGELVVLLDGLFVILLFFAINTVVSKRDDTFLIRAVVNAMLMYLICVGCQALANFESMLVLSNRRFTGISANPNHIGTSAALVLSILVFCRGRMSRVLWTGLTVANVVLVLSSGSRTALLMCLAVVLMLIGKSKRLFGRASLLVLPITLTIVYSGALGHLRADDTRSGVILSVWNQTNLWYGYTRIDEFRIMEGFWLYGLHALGVFGFLFAIFFLLRLANVAWVSVALYGSVFAALVAGNLTESIFSGNGDFKVIVFFLFYSIYAQNSLKPSDSQSLTRGIFSGKEIKNGYKAAR